eukprot:4529793-Alexandrium_andersonii.AAC.1
METTRDAPDVVPLSACQVFMDCALRHLSMMKRLGLDLAPKHHLWIHMMTRVLVFGNPRTYSAFVDETLNLTIA